MAQFKHITVTTPEEDEVIFAGAVDAVPDDVADGEPDSGPAAAAGAGAANAIPEAATGDAADSAHEDAAVDAASSTRKTPAADEPDTAHAPESGERMGKPRSAAPPHAKEAHRDPTLEDLQGEKMPLTQRIVIIAAVICLIGAIAYYFAFMV